LYNSNIIGNNNGPSSPRVNLGLIDFIDFVDREDIINIIMKIFIIFLIKKILDKCDAERYCNNNYYSKNDNRNFINN